MGAGETDETRATGRVAPGTQGGPKSGKLLRAFKAASKESTSPAPVTRRRRRRGDSRAAFAKAKRLLRPAAQHLPGFAWTTLDWLQQWQGNDAAFDADCNHAANPFIAPYL
jgi:hypothetical protein